MKINEVLSAWDELDELGTLPDRLCDFLEKRQATEFYFAYRRRHEGIDYYIVYSDKAHYYKTTGGEGFIGLYAVFPHTDLSDLHDKPDTINGHDNISVLKQKFHNVHGDDSYMKLQKSHPLGQASLISRKVDDVKIISGVVTTGERHEIQRIVDRYMRHPLS